MRVKVLSHVACLENRELIKFVSGNRGGSGKKPAQLTEGPGPPSCGTGTAGHWTRTPGSRWPRPPRGRAGSGEKSGVCTLRPAGWAAGGRDGTSGTLLPYAPHLLFSPQHWLPCWGRAQASSALTAYGLTAKTRAGTARPSIRWPVVGGRLLKVPRERIHGGGRLCGGQVGTIGARV